MKRLKLVVETREGKGKEINKKLRKTGYVPGIFYSSHDKDTMLLKIPEKELHQFLSDKKRSHGIIDLKIKSSSAKDTTKLAIIKDFQYDSVKRKINHFDFFGVTMKEKITLQVPLVFEGEPKGIKEGGILDISLREIEVECFPIDAPEAITIDISQLGFNDVLSLNEIKISENVKVLTEIDRTIASVIAPSKEEEVIEEEEEIEIESKVKEEAEAEEKEEK